MSYLKYFVQLPLVLHHNEVGLAVICDKLAFFSCACCVDPSWQSSMYAYQIF